MKTLFSLTTRNIKLFFKDKGMLFTSLITPIILLILYITFLGKIYTDNFASNVPEGVNIASKLIDGTVAVELVSSLLAVSCITVAFCSNLIMVQDKANGIYKDFLVAPVNSSTIFLAYFLGTFLTTLIVSFITLGLGFIYIAVAGWYFNFVDILLIITDCILLTLFGTALSSIINMNLRTNGQGTAVGTVVSAGYGFICGAYMPLSQFGEGLQNVLSLLPSTYGTSLIRNHFMRGVTREMRLNNFPSEVIDGIMSSVDCNLKFFGTKVTMFGLYMVLILSIVVIIGGILLIAKLRRKHNC